MRLSTINRAKIPGAPKPKEAQGVRAQPVIEEKPTKQKKVFSVDEEGYLIIRDDFNKEHRILAGDVSLRKEERLCLQN